MGHCSDQNGQEMFLHVWIMKCVLYLASAAQFCAPISGTWYFVMYCKAVIQSNFKMSNVCCICSAYCKWYTPHPLWDSGEGN